MEEKLNDQSNTITENSTTSSLDRQETRITIMRADDQNGDEKPNGSLLNKDLNDGVGVPEDKYSCTIIDVKSETLQGENQRVCRICHLNKLENGKDLVDLIELGCGCKGELGFAHTVCAEAWFKLRGNRSCEICSLPAKNVTGVGDNRFMEVWNESRLVGSDDSVRGSRRGCWRGQPLCNFLMACLVIAFVLPWFFRVNMF